MNQDERMYSLDIQSIDLTSLKQSGRVLDIGGGGEGIIGQLLGEKVVAIDPREDELEEAAEGPLKIIMDARELKFLDKSFDGVTSFFTLMYIEKRHHERVFEEIHRVLKDGGQFFIWDVTIPGYDGGTKDIFLVPLEIKLIDKKVTTTYGVSWDKAGQDVHFFVKLAENTGFQVERVKEIGETFCIELKKKIST